MLQKCYVANWRILANCCVRNYTSRNIRSANNHMINSLLFIRVKHTSYMLERFHAQFSDATSPLRAVCSK